MVSGGCSFYFSAVFFFYSHSISGKEKPGWAKSSLSFGFKDIRYKYNRGHWKYFEEIDGNTTGYHHTDAERFADKEEESYATDFLFDRATQFIKEQGHQDKPFALMLSIPDPHDPNVVRKPYDKMYDHFTFNIPRTQRFAMSKNPSLPKWSKSIYLCEKDNDSNLR